MPYLIGHGFDLHRLEPDLPLIIGGQRIEHDRGCAAHSDGDVVYHAVTDAVLGALGEPDIGQLFPDDDPRHEGADSSAFVAAARQRMAGAGFGLGNLDLTVVCEQPKIGSRKSEMIANLARLLDCDVGRINLKGKTKEQVDAVGEGRAVEVHAVVLLQHG